MLTLKDIKSSLSNNFPTIVMVGLVWWNLTTKINTLLIKPEVNSTEIKQIKNDINRIELTVSEDKRRITVLENRMSAHIGDAKIEESPKNEYY